MLLPKEQLQIARESEQMKGHSLRVGRSHAWASRDTQTWPEILSKCSPVGICDRDNLPPLSQKANSLLVRALA